MNTTDEWGALGVTMFEMPSDVEVRITRVVAAPKGLVFDVHTKPEHLPNWMLGPPGWTMPVCEIDLRPGGAYRYVWRTGDGAEMTISGTFHEVIRPDRLVSTEAWGGGSWPDTRNTVTFDEREGRTRITTTVRYPSQAARDAAVQSGMRDGMDAGYAGLDAYLAGLEPGASAFDMRLELVPVPVRDVDAAIAFYQGLPGLSDQPPGTLRALHLVVKDVHKAREVLLARCRRRRRGRHGRHPVRWVRRPRRQHLAATGDSVRPKRPVDPTAARSVSYAPGRFMTGSTQRIPWTTCPGR